MNKGSLGSKILLVVLPLLFVATMLVFIYFKVEQIKTVAIELVTEEAGLQQDSARLVTLEKLKSNEIQIKKQYDDALKLIPAEPMEESLINDIQEMAAFVMADFVQIRFNQREPAANFTGMPLEISFSGNYKDFIKLLESIRKGDRAIRIDNMTVSVTQDGTQKIRADITAHSFCLDTGLLQQQQQQTQQ